MKLKHLLLIAGIAAIPTAQAAVTITSTFTFADDFTGFLGADDPTNWSTSDVSSTSNWQGTGTGSSNAGGKYSFGDTGTGPTFDGSLGFLPSSSRAINADISFEVGTGVTFDGFTIGYTGEHWRSADSGRLNGWAVSWSLNGGAFNDIDDLSFVAQNDLGTTGVNPNGGPWASVPLSATVTPSTPFADGDTILIRFFGDNGTGGGSRQGVAIDDFSFAAVPEPSVGILGALGGLLLLRRRSR